MAKKLALYKLVVLGGGGVGKTALTIQLCLSHFVETHDPTVEDSYLRQVVIDDQACMLEVLDTAGGEEYAALRDQWIKNGSGFVLVYSVTSRESFSAIQKFHAQIQRARDLNSASSPTGPCYLPATSKSPSFGPVPVILVGNKADKLYEREVSSQEGRDLAKELGCGFVEASAKKPMDVENAFFEVVRLFPRQRQLGPEATGQNGAGLGARRASDYQLSGRKPHSGSEMKYEKPSGEVNIFESDGWWEGMFPCLGSVLRMSSRVLPFGRR